MSEFFYLFPTIYHIDDVLPHIADDPSFVVAEKECGHTYINYVRMGIDTFPPILSCDSVTDETDVHLIDIHNLRAEMRRECRGIAFDTDTGEVVSRPFHKFFNVGELDETDISALDFHRYHTVLEKLDGSMIRPIFVGGVFRLATKMGITDVALKAETTIAGKAEYQKLFQCTKDLGVTPIFEYVSPDNRIVAEYAKPELVLLSVRGNRSGTYWSHTSVKEMADRFCVPVVRVWENTNGLLEDPVQAVECVRNSTDGEGVVIQWYTGHMVKIKTDLYVALHKLKEAVSTERHLVSAILDDNVDDLLPLLPPAVRASVQSYVNMFWKRINGMASQLENTYNFIHERCETKKDFAVGPARDIPLLVRSMLFALWDGKVANAEDAILGAVKRALKSETAWANTMERFAETSLGSLNIPLEIKELGI